VSFREQLIITVVDKLAIAGLLLLVGWGLNRALERIKSQFALRNEFAKLRDAKELEFLDKQLSQFYYPLYIRLHIDGAVWHRILDRAAGQDDLRQKVGDLIERTVILPNHEEMVKIIQSNIHLAESDQEAFDAMLTYVRHVAVYKAMREAGCRDKDPLALGEPWPKTLLPQIEATTARLQQRYDTLASAHLANARKLLAADA
jgi:hypothetical protein